MVCRKPVAHPVQRRQNIAGEFARLLEHGIVVSPGESFGQAGEGYFRLALVPSLDQINHAIAVWSQITF